MDTKQIDEDVKEYNELLIMLDEFLDVIIDHQNKILKRNIEVLSTSLFLFSKA